MWETRIIIDWNEFAAFILRYTILGSFLMCIWCLMVCATCTDDDLEEDDNSEDEIKED